jgi:hypothetical protein
MIDAVIAVALAAAGQVAIWTGATSEGPRTVTVWTGLLITVPLAWRRSAPTGAALAWMAGGLAQAVLADSASAIWARAAARRGWRRWAARCERGRARVRGAASRSRPASP